MTIFAKPIGKVSRAQRIIELATTIILSPILLVMGVIVAWKLSHPKRYKNDGTPAKYNLDYEDVTFFSKDGLTPLSGWFMKSKDEITKGTIIFSHGYLGNRTKRPYNTLKLAKKYLEAGFDVFTFDFRNCGTSGGKFSSVGIVETEDLMGAVQYVKKNLNPTKIILMGWSTGGATSIVAASQLKGIAAIISDSAFDDLESYLKENLTKWTKLHRVINPFVLFMFPLASGGLHPRMMKPVDALKSITCPIMFVHSELDSIVPPEASINLYHHHKGEKQLWVTPSGEHIRNHNNHEQYTKKTLQFLETI